MSESIAPDMPGVFLDHHSTTPCDPRVVEAMVPCFSEVYGNPSSDHAWGASALERVEEARRQVAALVDGEPSEIVFTSGATESDNLAIFGVADALRNKGRHVITCVTEHKAVLDTCSALERRGFEITYLPVEPDGRVQPEAVRDAIRPETVLVSLMLANNEIGTLHPIAEISEICQSRGVFLHTDAAQALAYVDCSVRSLGADLMSISAHKAYGPKGIGALYVRRRRPRVRLMAQMHGGGHERGRRSGTLPVSQIVGLGKACELIAEQRARDAARLSSLRDGLLARLRDRFPDLVVHGSMRHRLPNNLNVSIPELARVGITSRDVLSGLPDVAVSSGSACTSSNLDGSYVLKALPGARSVADVAFRFGLGRGTTEAEVDFGAEAVAGAARRWIDRGSASDAESCVMTCEVA